MVSFQDDPFLQSFFYSNDPALSFSVEELEWLCEPQYANKIPNTNDSAAIQAVPQRAQAIKQHLAKKLAALFKTDNQETTQNLWKVHRYESQYQADPPPPPRQPTWVQLDTFYRGHALWYNPIRLFLVRVGRIAVACGRAFLPAFFSLFGLSFGITFLVDLAVILKVTFRPKTIRADWREGRGLWKPLWTRFKLILKQDNRPYRMANDFVWFMVNVITLAATGPLFLIISPFLNLVCFIFDVGHESFWVGWDAKKYSRLIKKLEKHIQHHQQDIESKKLSPESPDDEAHQNAINTLELLHKKMKNSRFNMLKRRIWITFWTAVLLISMAMVYFPPTTVPGVFLAGAVLALLSGSVFIGLGRRLYLTAEERLKSKPAQVQPADPCDAQRVGFSRLLQRQNGPTRASPPPSPNKQSPIRSQPSSGTPSSRGFFSAVMNLVRRPLTQRHPTPKPA